MKTLGVWEFRHRLTKLQQEAVGLHLKVNGLILRDVAEINQSDGELKVVVYKKRNGKQYVDPADPKRAATDDVTIPSSRIMEDIFNSL